MYRYVYMHAFLGSTNPNELLGIKMGRQSKLGFNSSKELK